MSNLKIIIQRKAQEVFNTLDVKVLEEMFDKVKTEGFGLESDDFKTFEHQVSIAMQAEHDKNRLSYEDSVIKLERFKKDNDDIVNDYIDFETEINTLVRLLDAAPNLSAYHGQNGFEVERFLSAYRNWKLLVIRTLDQSEK